MPLNTEYRPKSFDEIIGNKATIASLKAIYARERDWPHAVLIQGPKGCGKTTLARIIASLLNCHGQDLVQIDGGDVKAETVRSIKEQSRYKPLVSKSRVWIIDESHMIGQGGGTEKNIPQNNMLTLLEEPPEHAYFILCTTDPRRLTETIRSRCHTFEVQYLSEKDIIMLLKRVLVEEKINQFSENILKKIAEASDGCARDALKILDQIIDMELSEMESGIESFVYSEKQAIDLYRALEKQEKWGKIVKVLAQMDLSNPEGPRRAIIGLAAASVMRRDDKSAALIFDCFKEPFYNNGKAGFIFSAYQAMIELEDVVPF